MKAALIGAVAMGGATAAALTWTYLATVDPHPPSDRQASAPTVLDRAPAGPAAGPTPTAGPDTVPRAAPEAESSEPEQPPDLATRDTPAPADGSPAPTASPDRLAAIAPETAVSAAPPPGPAARTPTQTDAPRADPAPGFDVVRTDADGQTVIAGRAAPNERVEVLLDGTVVETMLADAGGRFVAVLSIGPSASARELRLRVTLPSRPQPSIPDAPQTSAGGPAGQTPAPLASGPPLAPGTAARSGPARPPPPAAGSGDGRTAEGVPPQPASPVPAAGLAGTANVAPERPGPLSATEATPATRGAASPASPPAMAPTAPGREAGEVVTAAADEAGAPAPPAEPAGGRYLLSDPVIILPTEGTSEAPALVSVQDERLALLQPGVAEATGVVLDQLTREPGGDLLLRGRARPGHAVRIYGNARAIDTVPATDGSWSLTVPEARAGDIRLFRLDEIARSGAVASRIEVPFQPSDAPSQVVRDRRITVQRGDNLWRIAEAHYGEGIRYSLIFGANTDLIRDPDLIYPEQVFTVPELVEAE